MLVILQLDKLGRKGGKDTLAVAILVSVVSKIYIRCGCGGRDGRVPWPCWNPQFVRISDGTEGRNVSLLGPSLW